MNVVSVDYEMRYLMLKLNRQSCYFIFVSTALVLTAETEQLQSDAGRDELKSNGPTKLRARWEKKFWKPPVPHCGCEHAQIYNRRHVTVTLPI